MTVKASAATPFHHKNFRAGSSGVNALLLRYFDTLLPSPVQLPHLANIHLTLAGCSPEVIISDETLTVLRKIVLGRSELRCIEIELTESPGFPFRVNSMRFNLWAARSAEDSERRRIRQWVEETEAASGTRVAFNLFGEHSFNGTHSSH